MPRRTKGGDNDRVDLALTLLVVAVASLLVHGIASRLGALAPLLLLAAGAAEDVAVARVAAHLVGDVDDGDGALVLDHEQVGDLVGGEQVDHVAHPRLGRDGDRVGAHDVAGVEA